MTIWSALKNHLKADPIEKRNLKSNIKRVGKTLHSHTKTQLKKGPVIICI